MDSLDIAIELVGHGGCYNRGCEAILRSSFMMLQDKGLNCRYRLHSYQPRADQKSLRDQPVQIIDGYELTPPNWLYQQSSHLISRGGRLGPARKIISSQLSQINHRIWGVKIGKRVNCVLSVGGDNFTLDYDCLPTIYMQHLEEAMQNKVPAVIWGASIGPFTAEPKFEKQIATFLKRVNLITARESATVNYLTSLGITDNVVRVWDPAFYLKPEEFDGVEAEFVKDGNVTGINISGLLIKHLQGGLSELIEQVGILIKFVLAQGQRVLLVPHVNFPGGDLRWNDEILMRQLIDSLPSQQRDILLVSSALSASQMKWLISQCRFFIGARTHSTIAAISTGVPCIAIAYSQKARGIWKDVFGNEDLIMESNYLSANLLQNKWEMLVKHESDLRRLLALKHPEMIQGAMENVSALMKVLDINI